MNYRMLAYLVGIIMLIEAALLVIPTLVALIYGESLIPFLLTIGLLVLLAIPLVARKPRNTRIYAKEGFVCVALAWIVMSLFGAIPFTIDGSIGNYVDALFETVSGFTTTGATILKDVERLPKGLLFWRSFTHFIGGMGVLVFMLAILPSDNGRAMHLLRAEVPGPTKDKLVPKMRQSALILYGIYMALTVVLILALLCAGMPLYDALVNAFGTAGTGGFSVKNSSIAAYNNPAAEWIIAVFLLLFGINFNLYFLLLMKRWKSVLKNQELRVYLSVCIVATVLIAVNVASCFDGAWETVRHAFFQVTSILTTAGFATTNYDLWPAFSKMIIILLTLLGACAGSTAGGLKISRVTILVKNVFCEIKHMVHPRSVNVVRADGEVVPEATLRSATNYLSVYTVFLAVTALIVSIDGFGFETNFTAALTCLNNVGPGLGDIGPAGNFSGFSYFTKGWLTFIMLVGRLEFMPMLVLLSPSVWRKR